MAIKLCKSWVENKNERCKKGAIWGANYCWWHYPKKALIFEFFLVMLLTLILSEPLTYAISKIPFLRYVDKDKPIIDQITPDVSKIPQIEKINQLDVFFSDKYSGMDLHKSTMGLQYKADSVYRDVQGQLNKNNSMLSFSPVKELKYGEYLLDILLVDKANNKNLRTIPFIVRPKEEISISVTRDAFEDSPYKNMFKEFIEDKKPLIDFHPIDSILQITIGNKFDNIAILKDLYFYVDISGGTFLAWEDLGNIEASGVETFYAPEALDKRIQKGRIYLSQKFVHIDKIAPGGLVEFVVLLAGWPASMPRGNNIWEGLEIWGTYLSEGYGRSESRKMKFRILKTEFKSSTK